ncbi:hypothetical protein KOW79_012200 [Hemibagrus wyckioides]|uniref:Uncharacterized protein n=1 Tax=Hemibagrus wyckioides TaxID=337641 RepID=A0A9D3SM07_9TELE|nr:hypothetical protein KOW79_012200 [Hemibagrus wyckioides]
MMVHAIKVQADVHRVPEFQVTAEELEGISLSQTEPDFTRGINPDEFSREPGNDSLVEDLDLILTGASPVRTSPAISRDRRVQHAPPRSGDAAIEILQTPTPRVASVTPVLKACDAPRRAKGLKFVSKSASTVKRLFTDARQEVYDNTAVFRQDPLQAIENAILSLNRSDNPFMEIEAAIRSINTKAGEREEEGGAAGHGRELREGEGGEEDEREMRVGGVAGEGGEEAEREMRTALHSLSTPPKLPGSAGS